MTKMDHQIVEKSHYIALTILLYDLECYTEDFNPPIDLPSLRSIRNVFVSLHNLNDLTGRIRLELGDEHKEFKAFSRQLRRDLEFTDHIRNKGVGHLDQSLIEKSAQWSPELFWAKSFGNKDLTVVSTYLSILESAINSFINEEGRQKVFNKEITLAYPADGELFLNFIKNIVERSILWIKQVQSMLEEQIHLHTDEEFFKFAYIAGITDFNLNSNYVADYNEEKALQYFLGSLAKLETMDVPKEHLDIMRKLVSGMSD